MKDLYHLESKAYKEGFEILSLLPKSSQNKIPSDVWDFIKENMDIHYNVNFENLINMNILDDTNILLAILFKSYLASSEEKEVIKAKEFAILKRKKGLL